MSLHSFSKIVQALLLVMLLASCQKKYKRNKSHTKVSFKDIERGETAAARYCQACHLLPDPSLADALSWEKGILPNMGPRLGIFAYGFEMYPSSRNDQSIDKDIYPASPLLGYDEWQNIIDYYTATSPDTMPPQKNHHAISDNLPFFRIEKPLFTYANSTTAFAGLDTSGNERLLFISDAARHTSYVFNQHLKLVDSIVNNGPVVSMDFSGKTIVACDVGIMKPHNGKLGSANFIRTKTNHFREDRNFLFDSLQRPVQVTPADLNGDGYTDYLICEFGFITGSLSWMENSGDSTFNRRSLLSLPGAVKAYIKDFNNDGLPDIMVLFAQGDESIVLFTNTGKGEFSKTTLLRFPPSYGSSYFELADFNNDGWPDILYTCGDNADYSPVLKPYHGVYIFMNDDSYRFTQKYFYPINGCYKAMARDFDGDGDLDVATISFFADYVHQPEEGFVYLQNTGNLHFLPFSLPGTEAGRWLTMDAEDIDGNGKPDIILGNFSIGSILRHPSADWKSAPPFLVLKNMSK